CAHRALAALAAVVDRGVDDIETALERAHHRIAITGVVGVVVAAQVGANADRREREPLQGAEVARGAGAGVTLLVFGRALWGGLAGQRVHVGAGCYARVACQGLTEHLYRGITRAA